MKNQYTRDYLKRAAWTVCRFKGRLGKKERRVVFLKRVDTPIHTMLELTCGQYTNFGDTLFGQPNLRKIEKDKPAFCTKIKNCHLYITLFSTMNIESEHINVVNRTINYQRTLILLCFCQYLDKKVGASFSGLSTMRLHRLKFCPSGWFSTMYNSTSAQIRAIHQLLSIYHFVWSLFPFLYDLLYSK